MRTSRLLLAAPLLGLVAFVACMGEPATDVGLVMLAPEGLLDTATSVKLVVFDAKGFTCDPATGSAGTPPKAAQTFPLSKDGCAAGKWCGSITLDKNGATKMFAVTVQNDSGLIGQGCTTAVINQDPLDVNLKVVRFVPPACCGDGVLQAGELCDSGGSPGCGGIAADQVCAADCSTNEIAVDRKIGDATPTAGSVSGLALSFASGNGQLQNGLRADFELAASGGSDIGVRFLKNDLSAITTPAGLAGPLRIPLKCTAPTGPGEARQQKTPAIATLDPTTSVIAFISDEAVPNNFNLFFSTLGADGCAAAGPTRANTVDNGVSEPHVAVGPASSALFVWSQNGNVMARPFDSTKGLGTEITIATGKGGRVAGTSSGWLVVYEGGGAGDDDGIFMKTVSAAGTVGSEKLVNANTGGVQDQPDVAAQSDGRALVAFHSGSDIYFQRFDASGNAVAGDQSAALNSVTDGEQANPAAVAGGADLFVVAWENQPAGDIWARYMGGSSGFVFNSINGQNSDFQASSPAITGARRKPVLAADADFIAMGWEDQSAHTGVFVRRFPIPK